MEWILWFEYSHALQTQQYYLEFLHNGNIFLKYFCFQFCNKDFAYPINVYPQVHIYFKKILFNI